MVALAISLFAYERSVLCTDFIAIATADHY